MAKSLEQFKIDTLGGRFGVPGTSNTNLGDPAYAGQCVSYVRLYMEEVLGIKTAVWGHAVSYWTNPKVLVHFDKVANPQDGDVVVWGDDPGNWTGPEGHIAIWYKGQLLNQNYGGNLRVTINNMFTPGLLGYLRPKNKGEEMAKIDEEGVRILAATILERVEHFDTTPDLRAHIGGDALVKIKEFWNSPEGKAASIWRRSIRKTLADKDAEIGALKQQVAELSQARPQEQSESDKKLAGLATALKDVLGIK